MKKMTTGTCAQGQSPINAGTMPVAKYPALDTTHSYLGEHKQPGNLKKGFAHKGKIATAPSAKTSNDS